VRPRSAYTMRGNGAWRKTGTPASPAHWASSGRPERPRRCLGRDEYGFLTTEQCYSVGMLTEILAICASVVSTGSLAIAYLAYRAGGPRLSGRAKIYRHYLIEGPTLLVDLYNRGRGPITVESIELESVVVTDSGPLRIIGWPMLSSSNCSLPSRLEGHTGEHWDFPAHDILEEWASKGNIARLEARIGLATGKVLTLPVDTYEIDSLRGWHIIRDRLMDGTHPA
jgi:hypothetical protein